MSEVLAPCFELFRGLADFLAELDKGVSKTARVEIWQTSSGYKVSSSLKIFDKSD
jgi:hypothetical protein